jgi:hypothetical protein
MQPRVSVMDKNFEMKGGFGLRRHITTARWIRWGAEDDAKWHRIYQLTVHAKRDALDPVKLFVATYCGRTWEGSIERLFEDVELHGRIKDDLGGDPKPPPEELLCSRC